MNRPAAVTIAALALAAEALAAPADLPQARAATESPHRMAPRRAEDEPLYRICGAPDAALAAVADRNATRMARGEPALSADENVFFLSAAGDPHPWARAFSIVAPTLDEAFLATRLDAWSRGVPALGARRCAIARATRADGSSVVSAIAVDALADMQPLPMSARVGEWLTLEATMLVPATGAKVVLLGPRGAPKTVLASLEGSTIRSTFAVDRAGAWLAQAVATVSTGPRPVLEATVYAGVPRATEFVEQPAPGEQAARLGTDDEDTMLRMINTARETEGLASLARQATLDRLAEEHAAEMLRAHTVGHDLGRGDPIARVEAAGIPHRRVGENVASAKTLEAAHRALWASPSHRENLLLDGYRHIGIGVVRGADGTAWVTEIFAE